MRIGTRSVLAAIVMLAPLGATTLVRLSLTEMIQQSTGIVRARVVRSFAANRGADIYTHYQMEVLEDLKGTPGQTVDVAVPGGILNGVNQSVAGAPHLAVDQEYVVFLWTSRSGVTQIIGLSQGLFNVRPDAGGKAVLMRPSAGEPMLDSSGRLVKDQPFSLSLNDLRAAIGKVLEAGN